MVWGLALIFVGLLLLGWRLAATRPEVWNELGNAGQAHRVLPPPSFPVKELPVPQLVSTGAGPLLTGIRHSAGWQAPDGTRLHLN
jgi:hypothetical protein